MAADSKTTMERLSQYPWSAWGRMIVQIASLDLRRNMLSWRAGWIYFLAFAPAIPLSLNLVFGRHRYFNADFMSELMGGMVEIYYIRLGIFFGCLGIFLRLIRGEMVERSLHFYLLSPVRREVLLLGKFLSGAVSSVALFLTAITVDYFLTFGRYRAAGLDFIFHGPGMGQLAHYWLIAVLACLGYGSVFLLLSMFFRNPLPMAMLVMGWEAINPVLPSLLQRLSIASYLKHMMPVSVTAHGLFALFTVNTEPVPMGWAVLGVLVNVIVVVAYSCVRMRKLEIHYLSE